MIKPGSLDRLGKQSGSLYQVGPPHCMFDVGIKSKWSRIVMNLTEIRRDGYVVVAPVGRLDSASASTFDRQLTAVIQRGEARLVLDLSGLEYVSSVGLSVFLAAAKKVKSANGRLVLAGLNDRIRLVFEMSGFLRLFPVFPTVDAAVMS